MIALIASALLGLYVFAPYIIFHRFCSLFVRLKKSQRTKTDEIVQGVVVAGLPFVLTILSFWSGWIGGPLVPFRLDDSHLQVVTDYHTVFTAAYSDHYFTDHQTESWEAFKRVCKRQADFLTWNYGFLLLETLVFIVLVGFYGKWRNFGPYAWFTSRVLLPAVSEWHVLLTDFTFPESRSVEVDAMSKDNILYRGNVVEHFLGTNGELSGLLLKDAQRYRYEKLKDDRKANVKKSTDQYWKPIPGGGNFYLPGDNIASLNIRYPLPKPEFDQVVKNLVEKLFNGAKVEPIIPTPEELQAGDIPIPGANKVEVKGPEEN
ncbi:MAG: hypothetical protein ABSF15_13615 [Candidatus Sulfotelmatobacter sp.]|jgi:hypothetical protein